MAKETPPLKERPDWLPNDGPRYLVSMETPLSCVGTKSYKGFFETDKLDEAILECSTAVHEEGKETMVWDRWEFQMVHKETPAPGVSCAKPKKVRKFLPVVEPVVFEPDGTEDGTDDSEHTEPAPNRRKRKSVR